jgi:hypothetical protein
VVKNRVGISEVGMGLLQTELEKVIVLLRDLRTRVNIQVLSRILPRRLVTLCRRGVEMASNRGRLESTEITEQRPRVPIPRLED